jgi:phospholipid transport system substrate-binding protein
VRRFLVVGLAVTLATLAASRAEAGPPTDALRDFFGAVNVVLSDPTTEEQPLERLRAIRRHVDDVFDFREAAVLALGREWAARTPVEQNEFVALFADLLERSFVWRVAGKATTAGGLKVDYRNESVEGDTAAVETAVAARDGNALRLGFRMVRRAERWVVRDIVMDGVSTMENYHAQFQRLVRDGSWPELMAQLRAKVGTPAGTVQVAAAPPPMMWPSELRAPDRVPEPMVPVPSAPVPSSIARPLETAVASPRPAPETPAVRSRTAQYAAPPPIGPTAPSLLPVASVETSPEAMPARRSAAAASEVAPSTVARDVTVSTKPPREIALATPAPAPAAPRIEPPPVSRAPLARPALTTWWVQVGAYRSASAAGRVAAQVRGEILVVATAAETEPLLRVRVGPFADRARALARLHELEAQGWRAFIAESRE